jgi:hypothetical protein
VSSRALPSRALLLLLLLPAAGCVPGGGAGGQPCGIGERQTWAGCEPAEHFYINLDERLQMVGDTSRRGIGVNACTFRAFPHQAVVEDDNCATYVFQGEFALEAFATSAGGVIVGLPEPILMAPDEEGTGCYDSDLFPSRGDLFEPGETFPVSGLGGASYPDFEVELTAPSTLAADMPAEVRGGEALTFEWLPESADMMVVLVANYDEGTDTATNIGCVFDDAAGAAEVPAEAIAELQSTDEVNLYLYRQNWQHLEPAGADGVIEVVATSSVTRSVPLLP